MTNIEFFLDLLPQIPPNSIRDQIFILIFIPLIIRLYFVKKLDDRFKKLVPKNRSKAIKLVLQLKIPRLKKFINQQLWMIFLPIIISLPVLYKFGLHELTLDDIPSNVSVIGAIGLTVWLLFDIQIALAMNVTFHKLLDLIEGLMAKVAKMPNFNLPIDGSDYSIFLLEAAVKIRKKMLFTQSIIKSTSNKIPDKNFFPKLGTFGEEVSKFIRNILQTPIDMVRESVEQLIDSSIEQLNNNLDNFLPEDLISTKRLTWNIFWASFPSLWLAFLVEYNQLSV
jgi:hypothetical protein